MRSPLLATDARAVGCRLEEQPSGQKGGVDRQDGTGEGGFGSVVINDASFRYNH